MRINKEFFIHNFNHSKNKYNNLVSEIFNFITFKGAKLDKHFSVIVNQGPGSFSGVRISLAIAKGLEITKNVKLFGFKNTDLSEFNKENVEKLLNENLIEKKLIQPIYLS